MRSEARSNAFFRELDALRSQRGRLDPPEIARIALKAGLTTHEALIEIQRHHGYRHFRTGDFVDALALFISSLCQRSNAKSILEYTSIASLLTLPLTDNEQEHTLTYISPDHAIASALQVLLENKSCSVVRDFSGIPKDSRFDAIVCQPPIGNRSPENEADGFGGEIVRKLAALLAETGTLYWVTARGALSNSRSQKTLGTLAKAGLKAVATIDVAPGAFPGTMIEGAVIAIRKGTSPKKFVGALRDLETAQPMAAAILGGPTRKEGLVWAWLDADDQRTFADLEQTRLIQKLMPRGRHKLVSLQSLLLNHRVEKADKPARDDEQTAAFLFVPEYAGSHVTADLEEQTVKPNAVYRLPIDPSKANSRFLARLLNSPFGKHLRATAASGATIQRIRPEYLCVFSDAGALRPDPSLFSFFISLRSSFSSELLLLFAFV